LTTVFSTRCQNVISCEQPVLTIGFPTCPTACAGANTIVLANGAVVDLNVLGEIISRTCPAFVCPVPPTQVVTQAQTLMATPSTALTDPLSITGQMGDMDQATMTDMLQALAQAMQM
jgi:hypothetical protein